jgi:hypothetical protein
MMNNAVALHFLRVDWEAQRLAFDLARSSEFSIVPPVHMIALQTSFDFTLEPEDPAVPARDPLLVPPQPAE